MPCFPDIVDLEPVTRGLDVDRTMGKINLDSRRGKELWIWAISITNNEKTDVTPKKA